MLRTRLWMGAVLIALVVSVLGVDPSPWFPFLFLLLLVLSLAGCHELLQLLAPSRPLPGWLGYTAGLPDPDLLIRTAGELRVSNFLLWQISYAELWVTERCWPDFDRPTLHQALRDYARRERRYGGLSS